MANKKQKGTEVEVTFSITLPPCSKKNAKMLMEEAIGALTNASDDFDSLFDSFSDVFPSEDKDGNELDPGYSYGFGDKIKVTHF